MSWFLYLLECKSGAYYAGITNDLDARYAAHQQGTGAKYTRANPPLRILASKPYPDRSTASLPEMGIVMPSVPPITQGSSTLRRMRSTSKPSSGSFQRPANRALEDAR